MSDKLAKITGPVPPLRLARSLEEAERRTLVYLDRRGQVRSPARYRLAQAWSYVAITTAVGAATAIYGALLGAPGIAVGAALAGYYGWQVRLWSLVRRGTVLLVNDRLDDAEALLRRALASRGRPRRLAATIEQNLATISARRGDHEQALAHGRAALGHHGDGRSPALHAVRFAEVITLVNLGRAGEARQRLDAAAAQTPSGNYLQMQRWGSELYVCLAEGDHRLDGDRLHALVIAGLKTTTAAPLLGLLAWAHWKRADPDQAWHLLREAYERGEDAHLDKTMPLLWSWMEEHRAEASSEP